MEEAVVEEVIEELGMAEENLLSFEDNFRGHRYRKAASDIYFVVEHSAKALLKTVGVHPESHKGVERMLSYHFVKPGAIPIETIVHFENLYERRKIAEYSSRAGWEFSAEQVETYRKWVSTALDYIFGELRKYSTNYPEVLARMEKIKMD